MCKNKVRYTIDNDSEQLLLKDKDEETDLIEQAELIFSMARFIMNDEKIKEKPLYHFSSESYYLNIYKDYIELYGYEYSIKNENLGKYEMNFISRIERILCSNGNIEIYYSFTASFSLSAVDKRENIKK